VKTTTLCALVIAVGCGGKAISSAPPGPDDSRSAGGMRDDDDANGARSNEPGGARSNGGGAGTGSSDGTAAVGNVGTGGSTPSTGGLPACTSETFESLGPGQRCAGAGSRAQDGYSEKIEGATLLECEAKCRAEPTCNAVVNYPYEEPLGCYLRSGPCEDQTIPIWAEEDAGKEYVKVCDETGCSLPYLGHWMRCGEESYSLVWLDSATVLGDCKAACLDDPNCTSVIDYFWLAEVAGCYLFHEPCSASEPLPYGDPGETFRKCE
jgi:hypothetical protein